MSEIRYRVETIPYVRGSGVTYVGPSPQELQRRIDWKRVDEAALSLARKDRIDMVAFMTYCNPASSQFDPARCRAAGLEPLPLPPAQLINHICDSRSPFHSSAACLKLARTGLVANSTSQLQLPPSAQLQVPTSSHSSHESARPASRPKKEETSEEAGPAPRTAVRRSRAKPI